MPPPVPFVTRRDIFEQEERPVPKSPPAAPARPHRTLETIARRLNQARAPGQIAEAERLEDEFYRKLVTHYASTDTMPSNAQEKYDILRELMQRWRDIGGRATEFYRVLEREYRNVFELVSFRFDDPNQLLTEDLGLED